MKGCRITRTFCKRTESALFFLTLYNCQEASGDLDQNFPSLNASQPRFAWLSLDSACPGVRAGAIPEVSQSPAEAPQQHFDKIDGVLWVED